MTPMTVQTGTVMSVIWTVSQNADWNAGRDDRLEDRLDATLEGAHEDHHDREHEQQPEVEQHDGAHRQTGGAGLVGAALDGPRACRGGARGGGHAASE